MSTAIDPLGDVLTVDDPWLLLGDCLDRMTEIPDQSVDMVCCDLPYGTTAAVWDSLIPFEPLWAHYRRVCKPEAALVFTAAQPFTAALVMSNPKWFRYTWVWEKNRGTGFLDAKKRPLRFHEDVVVFYARQPTYNPQRTQGKPNNSTGVKPGQRKARVKSEIYHGDSDTVATDLSGLKYPRSILTVDGLPPTSKRLNPTQKPVELMEYLIRTYTNQADVVLDNTAGSFTTGVACANLGRRFIGIEQDEAQFDAGSARVREALAARQGCPVIPLIPESPKETAA